MSGFFAVAFSRFLRPYVIDWAIAGPRRKFKAQHRQEQIDRLAGGADVDAAIEAALDAAEAACERFCHEHPGEARAILDGKASAEARDSWNAQYRAVELAAYNDALTEARKGSSSE